MYYFLKIGIPNSDNNEIVPQVENMGPGYDWSATSSITNLSGNAPLSFVPNFDAFHLDPDTKLTDVISQAYITPRGVLASDKFCRILEGFVAQRCEVYPAKIVLHGEAYHYHWLHMTEEVEDRIDYVRSQFFIEPILRGAIENTTLADKNELDALRKQLIDKGIYRLKASRIRFNSGTPVYDFFCLQFTSRTFFASSPLADRLSAIKATGFELQPTEMEFVFPKNQHG